MQNLGPESGDFIISEGCIPHACSILRNEKLQVEELNRVLSFLELFILNERLICCSGFDYEDYYTLYDTTEPTYTIDEQIGKLIENEVLFKCKINTDEPLHVFFKRIISKSEGFKNKLEGIDDFDLFFNESESYLNNQSFLELLHEFGNPLYLNDFAQHSGISYSLSPKEVSILQPFEKVESNVYQSVISVLHKKLNDGAKEKINQLSNFGVKTIFPETPIGWLIIKESNTPQDIVKVALQLRNHYSKFRRNMIQIEEELKNENTSLKKKLKQLNELEQLAEEIWPNENRNKRKVATELTSIVGGVSKAVSNFGFGSTSSLATQILNKPLDSIIKALRRRRIRTVLETKKDFFAGHQWSQKISSILSIPEQNVKSSILEWKRKES